MVYLYSRTSGGISVFQKNKWSYIYIPEEHVVVYLSSIRSSSHIFVFQKNK